MPQSLRLAVLGTDTGVGKTHVTTQLTLGLRKLSRKVWLHKPVACGGWVDGRAEDGHVLASLLGDGQPEGTLCPVQLPVGASPHIAARYAGRSISLDQLRQGVQAVTRGEHDLLLEGVGGVAVPMTSARETVLDLLKGLHFEVLLVLRPHLGTLNHTQLSLIALRQAGLRVRGLIVNCHETVDAEDVAVATLEEELPQLTGLKVLAWLSHNPAPAEARKAAKALAEAVLGATPC